MFEQYDERKKRIDELIKRFGSGEIIGDSNSLEGANLKRAENEIKQDIEQKNTDQSGKFDKFLSEGGYALLPLITGGLGALLSRRGQKNRGFALGFQAGAQPAIQIPNAIQERYQKEATDKANKIMSTWNEIPNAPPLSMDALAVQVEKQMGKTKYGMVDASKLYNDIVSQRIKYVQLSDEEIRNKLVLDNSIYDAFQTGTPVKNMTSLGTVKTLYDGSYSFPKMQSYIGATQQQVRTNGKFGGSELTGLSDEQYKLLAIYKSQVPDNIKPIIDKCIANDDLTAWQNIQYELQNKKIEQQKQKAENKPKQGTGTGKKDFQAQLNEVNDNYDMGKLYGEYKDFDVDLYAEGMYDVSHRMPDTNAAFYYKHMENSISKYKIKEKKKEKVKEVELIDVIDSTNNTPLKISRDLYIKNKSRYKLVESD